MMTIFTVTIQAELVLPYTAYEHTIQHKKLFQQYFTFYHNFLKRISKTQYLISVSCFDFLRHISMKNNSLKMATIGGRNM